MGKGPLPLGRFRYEHGSYGGAGGYMPSILCYKETGPELWVEHFCLVKPDAVFDEEDSASETAEKHLAEARALMDAGGSIRTSRCRCVMEGIRVSLTSVSSGIMKVCRTNRSN